MTTKETKSTKTIKQRLKGWWSAALPIIDRIAWVAFPPYGFYIGIRHVRQNWDEYMTLGESGALMLAERAGYNEEEMDLMLADMKASRYDREAKKLAKKERRKQKMNELEERINNTSPKTVFFLGMVLLYFGLGISIVGWGLTFSGYQHALLTMVCGCFILLYLEADFDGDEI